MLLYARYHQVSLVLVDLSYLENMLVNVVVGQVLKNDPLRKVIRMQIGRLLGDDYFFTFREVTESFLRGETRLYDSNSVGFYNAPWTILVILPTVFLSLHYGEALLIVASLIGILVSVAAVSKKNNDKFTLLIIALAVVNLYIFDLLTRGNIDGILVLGIGLGWFGIERKNPILLGIGLWLLSIKPLNVVLPTLVFMKAIWHWPRSDKLKAIAPLAATFLISFPIFGVDWISRYIKAFQEKPPMINPQITLWRLPEPLGFQQELALWLFVLVVIAFGSALIKTKSVDRMTLALALSVNLVFSPYVLGSHYVLLIPVFVILAQELKWMLAIWLLNFIPLALLILRAGIYWPNILYPLSMMFGSGYLVFKKSQEKSLEGL